MKSNKEVIHDFMRGISSNNSLLSGEGDRLLSYNTPIIKYYGNTIWINATRYSVTTSKHQTLILRDLSTLLFKYDKVTVVICCHVLKGTYNFTDKKYVKEVLQLNTPCMQDIELITFLCSKYKNV